MLTVSEVNPESSQEPLAETRLGAIFGNADFSLHKGKIGDGEVYDADSRAGATIPKALKVKMCWRRRRRNGQDVGVPDPGDRKIAQG